MVQHNAIDHTGLTGVSTVSYASNVNRVDLANYGGAASTVTRGDHVHLGVTSLSHTSNTFSGPVTLVAQGTLGITSPSTGTFALSAGAGAAGAAGGGGIVHAIASRTSGNISLTSTTEANLDTGLDLTVAAAAGDIITVHINGQHDNSAHVVNLDVATIVSAAPVNYFGVGLAGTNQGLLGWSKQNAAFTPIAGSMTYVVVAGDISGGNVVLRLRYKTDGATSLIYATTALLFRWSATVQTP